MGRSAKRPLGGRGNDVDYRSLKRKRRYIPGLALRIAALLLGACVAVSIALVIVARIERPWKLASAQSIEIASQNSLLQATTLDNLRLERRCAYLNRPDGIENEARLQGYVKSGEISIVLDGSPSDSSH